MSETKTEWYIIVNPQAGSGAAISEWIPAERMLIQNRVPYVTVMTDHKSHAVSLAHEAAAKGYRRIAAVGGDGSLHEVFEGICSYCDKSGTPPEEFYLAVLPIGSGNDWIKSCHVPNDMEKVIRLIIEESFGWMDVVRAKSRGGKINYMANGAGIGYDSHVCDRVNQQKEQGMHPRLIYMKALHYALLHLKPVRIVVWGDGAAVFAGEAYSLAIGNGPWSGGGMRQVPLAVNDDGLLDYMIVPKTKLYKLIKEVPRLFSGTVNESTIVYSGRCKSLRITLLDETSPDIVECDGEIEGQLPLELEITGSRIHVLKG